MNSVHNTNKGYNNNENIKNRNIDNTINNNLNYETEISKQVINLEELQIQAEGCVNPFNKHNKPITENWVQNLLKKYGIYQNINNLEHYQKAFIHQSYTESYVKDVCIRDNVTIVPNPDGHMLLQKESYERQEWLGDCLIDTFVGTYIYNRYPNANEGFMSSLKKALISRWVLGQLAEKCGFQEYMVVSKTLDDKCEARRDIKKCCDVFEAFIGAIYLDFNKEKHGFLSSFMSGPGFQVAEKFFINLLEDPESGIDITSYIIDDKNYVVQLRNFCCRMLGCRNAKYSYSVFMEEFIDEDNKPHSLLSYETNDENEENVKLWKIDARVDYKESGQKKYKIVSEIHASRTEAKQICARKMLIYFNQINV